MENTTIKDKVLLKASQWNLEDDCFLLQWMQEISTKIEELALNTSNSLERLSANVNSSRLALDNASNYFTALQYAQFVESRVQGDEDEITTRTIDIIQENQNEQQSKDIVKSFLLHNINMLHKWHEKSTLDFGDSDNKEITSERCIYKSKNFYNNRPLPHIFGSKIWKQTWHVGLLEDIDELSCYKSIINPELPVSTEINVKSDFNKSSTVTEKTSLSFPLDPNPHNASLQKPTLINQPDITEQNSLSHQHFINPPDKIEKTQTNFGFHKDIDVSIEDEQNNIKKIQENSNFTNKDNPPIPDSFSKSLSSRDGHFKNIQNENTLRENYRDRKYVNLFDENDFSTVINQFKDNNQQFISSLKNSGIVTENSFKHNHINVDTIDQNIIKTDNGNQRNKPNLFESKLLTNSSLSNEINPKKNQNQVLCESDRIRKQVNLFKDNDLTTTSHEFTEDNFNRMYSENYDISHNSSADIFVEKKNEPFSDILKKKKENEKGKANKFLLFDDEDDSDDFLNVFGKKHFDSANNTVKKDGTKSNEKSNESIRNDNIFDDLNKELKDKVSDSDTNDCSNFIKMPLNIDNKKDMNELFTDFVQTKSKKETKIDLTEEFLEDNKMNMKNTSAVNEIAPKLNNETKPIGTKKIPNYQYTNIFLDEQPPDDDEEFERTISGNSFSNFKDVWRDLDEDVYEPSIVNDVYNKPDYNYLSLFSDTPPPSDNFSKSHDKELKESYDQMDKKFKNPADDLLAGVINHLSLKDDEKLNKTQSKSDSIDDLVTHKEDFNEKIIHQSNLIEKIENEKSNIQTQLPSSKSSPLPTTSLVQPKYESLINKQKILEETTETLDKWDKVNILQNVCKDRVRVPSKRRPSTRKARYENYKKSEDLAAENSHNQNNTKNFREIASKPFINEKEKNTTVQISKSLNFPNPKVNTQNTGSIFDDDSDSDDFFKSNIQKKTKQVSSIKYDQNEQSKESFGTSLNSLDTIFGNDDEDDFNDNFMQNVKTKSRDIDFQKLTTKHKNQLFSDISGEDYNLFYNTSQNENIIKPVKAEVVVSEVKKVSTNSDNPLADLLNS